MSRGIFHLWLGARRIFVLGIQPHCLNGPSRSESSLAHSRSWCSLVWGAILLPPGASLFCRDGDVRFSKPVSAMGGQKLPTRVLSETRGLSLSGVRRAGLGYP